jgi:hypothetical protein
MGLRNTAGPERDKGGEVKGDWKKLHTEEFCDM